jgi:hypothetical protein
VQRGIAGRAPLGARGTCQLHARYLSLHIITGQLHMSIMFRGVEGPRAVVVVYWQLHGGHVPVIGSCMSVTSRLWVSYVAFQCQFRSSHISAAFQHGSGACQSRARDPPSPVIPFNPLSLKYRNGAQRQVLRDLVALLRILDVSYAVAPPVADTGGRKERFEPCRIDQTGLVSTLLHFTPQKERRGEAEAGADGAQARRQRGENHHERKPSLEAGVLRMYKWDGPAGRGEAPEKKRQAAIASVVAVVCCSEEDAGAMLDYCGWDVTHAVERFLAGHPAPAPRRAAQAQAAAASRANTLTPHPPATSPPLASGGGRGADGSSRAGGGGGGQGGGVAGTAGSDVGLVRLPEGTGTGSGRVDFGDGSAFTGSWVDGMVQGHGTFTCRDKRYTGEFLDGRMHGKGLHCWTTPGALLEYDGGWRQGLMHGRGIVTKGGGPDRLQYECEFQEGRLVNQKPLHAKPQVCNAGAGAGAVVQRGT